MHLLQVMHEYNDEGKTLLRFDFRWTVTATWFEDVMLLF